VIVLKYLEGFDNERVAQSMDKPVGAVKALQHRALDALRRRLIPAMEVKYE
jgi:RNA polymerase sigma-70 factor, ECF subfamily